MYSIAVNSLYQSHECIFQLVKYFISITFLCTQAVSTQAARNRVNTFVINLLSSVRLAALKLAGCCFFVSLHVRVIMEMLVVLMTRRLVEDEKHGKDEVNDHVWRAAEGHGTWR